MKFEKRTEETEASTPIQEPAPAPAKAGKKPVLIYILILFIAAFLLMSLSFFMHQRSNSEALGELQNSVSALQEIQATQDQNIRLQKELDQLLKEQDTLEKDLSSAQDKTLQAENTTEALLDLYTLQQQFSAEDFDACRTILQSMEDQGLTELLPNQSEADGIPSPAERYQQIKEAVLNA